MKAKIILKLDTENEQTIKEFANAMNNNDCLVIPKFIDILIKDKEGYWSKI